MFAQRWSVRLRHLLVDEMGAEMLEYVLLATFIIFPLTIVVAYLVDMLRVYYGLIAFTTSLPVP